MCWNSGSELSHVARHRAALRLLLPALLQATRRCEEVAGIDQSWDHIGGHTDRKLAIQLHHIGMVLQGRQATALNVLQLQACVRKISTEYVVLPDCILRMQKEEKTKLACAGNFYGPMTDRELAVGKQTVKTEARPSRIIIS